VRKLKQELTEHDVVHAREINKKSGKRKFLGLSTENPRNWKKKKHVFSPFKTSLTQILELSER
jgi:hypothetical protein